MAAVQPESDNFFLSWGSSVNVCEDLRRSIRKEIEDIDASISTLHDTVKAEDVTSNQLAKDLSHARNEMENLGRGATDVLDNAVMNEKVRQRLMESLQDELASKFVKGKKEKSAVSRNDDGEDSDSLTDTAEAPDADGAESPMGLDSDGRIAEVRKLARIIAEERCAIAQLVAEERSLEEQKRVIAQQALRDDLKSVLQSVEAELEAKEAELAKEERRRKETKVALHETRTKCGMYAQQIANSTRELTAMKEQNASERDELEKSLAKAEAELKAEDPSSLEKDLENATQHVNQFAKILKEFEEQQTTCRKVRVRLKEIDIKCKEQTEANKEQQQVVERQRGFVVEAVGKLEEAKSNRAALEAKKVEEEKRRTEEVAAWKAEKEKVAKQTEDASSEITSLNEATEARQREAKLAIEAEHQRLKNLKKEHENCLKQVQEQQSTKAKYMALRTESKDAVAKELADCDALCAKMTEAIEAEKTRIEEAKAEHKRLKTETLAQARIESTRARESVERHLEILLCASEKFEEVQNLEKEIMEMEQKLARESS